MTYTSIFDPENLFSLWTIFIVVVLTIWASCVALGWF